MRKRFTKIICVMSAVISVLGASFASACGDYKFAGVTKDTTADKVSSNGGFLVETGDYVYFVNGKASYTDTNKYGKVVKGSIQRISKSDLDARNYSNTETIVPVVVYSGNYDTGIYIYGDNIYYSTPSTEKNSDGEVQNSYLEFKSSSLDGKTTMRSYYYQSSSNSIAYRYVQVDGVVYLMYALSESLYGSSTTNIHSVNTVTGDDTILAYNVSDYVFDSEDCENPYVYYTMDVTNYIGSDNSVSESYNQVYRVRADATVSPREYDFSNVSDYDAEEDPLYINLGDYVLDGIGIIENGNSAERVSQFNYGYYNDKTYVLDHHDYTYELTSYKQGKLLFTVAETIGDEPATALYSITDKAVDSDGNGRVDDAWDAVMANYTTQEKSMDLVLSISDSNEYNFVTFSNNEEKVVYVDSDGIKVGEIKGGKLQNEYVVSDASSAEIVALREETTAENETHLYAYYSGSKNGTSGYYRIAVDGDKTNYERNKLQYEDNWVYKDVRILDISMDSSWYAPEFVNNQLIFASSTEGMSSYNYIMVCDLRGDNGYMISNQALNAYDEQLTAVFDKIEAYDDEENEDGTQAYENLADALKYQFYTGDTEYLAELIAAYVEIQDQDEEYLYSKESVAIYNDYGTISGDWASYKTDANKKQVNGEDVYSTNQNYYYSVLGKVTDDDADGIKDTLKSSYMQSYPDDTRTWWEKINTAAKVLFIIGMCLAGLIVIAGLTILTIFIVKKIKAKKSGDEERVSQVDITDDKSIDVYGTEENADHIATLPEEK